MSTVSEPRVLIRQPLADDCDALIAANRASAELYGDWMAPPTTREEYAAYLDRCANPVICGRLVCRVEDGAIMGAITLSQIFYGALQSAYMGYYIAAPFARRGYMGEAIGLMLDYAFGPLDLHRIEANIQPGNQASIALVRSLGFTREGYSRRYLHIAGDWRDHERWAMLAEDWADLNR